jgi:hypothetical protein
MDQCRDGFSVGVSWPSANPSGNCGQLSHCLPDNIDAHRLVLLEKFKTLVPVDPHLEPPGGANRKFTAVAAE